MLDFVVISMVLQNNKKEKYKSNKIIEMKQNDIKQQDIKVSKNSCEMCGQYLPWFCMCYLNKK